MLTTTRNSVRGQRGRGNQPTKSLENPKGGVWGEFSAGYDSPGPQLVIMSL